MFWGRFGDFSEVGWFSGRVDEMRVSDWLGAAAGRRLLAVLEMSH